MTGDAIAGRIQGVDVDFDEIRQHATGSRATETTAPTEVMEAAEAAEGTEATADA